MLGISYPLILDGGLSNELEKLGCNLDHELWTAKALESDIDTVVQLHLNYLNAGAKIISTVGYQASVPGLLAQGWTKVEAEKLMLKSVWAAETARDIYAKSSHDNSKILIAASMGPYGAFLADGSEYRGNYKVDSPSVINFHTDRIGLFEKSNADILAFETFPDYRESKVISELTATIEKPSWISFTTRNENEISDGTPIEKCVELFADHPNIFAIGINCLPPNRVSPLIPKIKSKCKDKKVIVYPNSGDMFDHETQTWKTREDSKSSLVAHMSEWIDLGADIIGGCCRIGPEEINNMSDYLSKLNRTHREHSQQ